MADVSERDFEARVVERSRELPVVVDFWAEWCGPCRTLGPALEAAIAKREGQVELAKVDVDSNQRLAAAFGIRGIPAVKAFRDGKVAAEFTGALPPARIEEFLDGIVPSQADRLAASGDEASLRAALEADPTHAGATAALARILIARGEAEEARSILDPVQVDFVAAGLLARLELVDAAEAEELAPELAEAFDTWDSGDAERALDLLQSALEASDDPEQRDLLRQVMVAIFTELGSEHPLARSHRRRLAAALT